MKILHVYRTCYPETNGGVEQVIRSISEGCNGQEVESKVLTLSEHEKKAYYINQVEIIPIKKTIEIASNGFSIRLIKKFRELSNWADIIHYHYPWPSGDLLSLLTNKPSVLTYHSDIVRQRALKVIYKPLQSYFLNKVRRIVATSPQYAQSSINLKKYKEKVDIIPLAIDPNNYKVASSDALNKWKFNVGEGFFLFVGVLRYYKGLHFLIEAAAKNKLPLVIAGDGPMKAELIAKAESLGVSNISFLGFVTEEDKVALLTLAKAFVFSSHLRSEAFGVSLLEAQLFSKPLITCDVGTGSSYVNQDKSTGLIVPPGDAEALSSAMVQLDTDQKLTSQYGHNANQRFYSLFTNEIQCSSYISIYRQLIETNSN